MAPIIDIHTHMYPPSYISLLSSRTTIPYIHTPTFPNAPRLIILPTDDDASLLPSRRGRPIDSSYSSIDSKLSFMKTHSIAASVISLANPWLDFLPASTAAATARSINDEMEDISAAHPKKIYFFGTLPLSAPIPEIVQEIQRLATLPHLKGIILGTTGLGAGLDDPVLDPLWQAIEKAHLLTFIHPHYGLPTSVFGPLQQASGHILPLALGFPFETTIAFTRLYLCGVFDRFPDLKVLLAHAGGCVPFLAGRIESCVLHERKFRNADGEMREGKGIWEVLRRNVWLDGVVYSDVGVKAAVGVVGKERVMWGTDHPFFPPLEMEARGDTRDEEGGRIWASVQMNVEGVKGAFGEDKEGAEGVLGGNAVRLLGLGVENPGG